MNKATADQLGIEVKADLAPASPERIAREAAQLTDMVTRLNKEAGVQPPPSEPQVAKPFILKERQPVIGGGIIGTALNTVAAPAKPAPVTHARSPFNPRLLFYTGRLKAGKDFVAASTGATIFGMADPLYKMREVFFGAVHKDQFGSRELLQWMGQVGRGVVSAQYNLNASRASFTVMVRSMGARGEFGFPDVDWASFGKSENIWLNAMLKRIEKYRAEHGNEDARIAVTNARFKNEVDALTAAGFTHFHATCSQDTWQARIRAAGLDPASPAMVDTSEQMALSLDKQARQAAQRNPNQMLRCVWSDDKQACPTPKAFHTIESFKADLELFS